MGPNPGFDQPSSGSHRDGASDGGEHERILDAARTLLRTNPSSALTRPEVARLAGLRPDIVSRHFRNKHSLMAELDAVAGEAALEG